MNVSVNETHQQEPSVGHAMPTLDDSPIIRACGTAGCPIRWCASACAR